MDWDHFVDVAPKQSFGAVVTLIHVKAFVLESDIRNFGSSGNYDSFRIHSFLTENDR